MPTFLVSGDTNQGVQALVVISTMLVIVKQNSLHHELAKSDVHVVSYIDIHDKPVMRSIVRMQIYLPSFHTILAMMSDYVVFHDWWRQE